MSASTEEVLGRLSVKIPIRINSTAALVTDTNKAAAAIDRQRARKQDEKEPSPRKPELGPLRGVDRQDLVSTPWDLLDVFARATTLARQGRGRGLAEHWQGLKYCQAVAAGPSSHMALTDEGQSPELSYRAMQARELGRSFGLAVAERTVRNRFPGPMVSTLDAEAMADSTDRRNTFDRRGVQWDYRGSRCRRRHPVRGGNGLRIGRCGRRCAHRAGLSPRALCSGSSGV
ncbi:hypothetical protein [Streptomyces sp. T12]|uniref:hypothetical protein n=1 Tax=Streptomyces sp. T12 TaxID=477697 RepID=UPI00119D4613|nr:hypothetical protein [Streptomyces sp. T12]